MPCRSSLASISLRPRDSCERSRRPSGASGGGDGGGVGFATRTVLAAGGGSAIPNAYSPAQGGGAPTVYKNEDEAIKAGNKAGSVVMMINPATGQPQKAVLH